MLGFTYQTLKHFHSKQQVLWILDQLYFHWTIGFFFLISNNDLLINWFQKERDPSTQEVYKGVHIKYKNYINQVNPK